MVILNICITISTPEIISAIFTKNTVSSLRDPRGPVRCIAVTCACWYSSEGGGGGGGGEGKDGAVVSLSGGGEEGVLTATGRK